MCCLDCLEADSSESLLKILLVAVGDCVVPISEASIAVPGTVHAWVGSFLLNNSEMAAVTPLVLGAHSSIELALPGVHELPISDGFVLVVMQLLVLNVSQSLVVSKILTMTSIVRTSILIKFHLK